VAIISVTAATSRGHLILPLLSNRHRFLWRLRAPVSPDETRRIERWLAAARVFLVLSALVSLWIDSNTSHAKPPLWLVCVFVIFMAHSVVVMLLLRWRAQSTPEFRLVVHGADIIFPTVIGLYGSGQHGLFFLFFVFVLLAAAYRWGLLETLGTAMTAVALLFIESYLISRPNFHAFGVNPSELDVSRLSTRAISLVITGLFLGYLAEQQKQLRAEKAVIASVLGKARVEQGLTGTLQGMFHEILATFGAKSALIASQEANSFRVFVGRVLNTPDSPLTWLGPKQSDRDVYLAEPPGDAFYADRKNSTGPYAVVAVDQDGEVIRKAPTAFVERLAGEQPFASVASFSFVFGREWWGRIFLFDPLLTGDRPEELRFLQELIRQVGPAVYNVYLLRRLRLRAGAVERARVARELHDGAVQSLIAMEMQVDVVRRQCAGESEKVSEELGRIQGLLREEVLKLRELMQEMKSIDVDARRLPIFITDTVERFQRETGISARFVYDHEPTGMEPRVCREVARIVQEGLVNVRKHSKAKQVLIRMDSGKTAWRLTIEDNGRGFDFEGKLTQSELDQARKGPVVIKERVRLIDGELTIESNPGSGARLEITVPQQQREAAYG
jgi:signal transduction histidine kinase